MGAVTHWAAIYRAALALGLLYVLLQPLRQTLKLPGRVRGGRNDSTTARASHTTPLPAEPLAALEAIAAWIGTPVGRGRLTARPPEFGMERRVKVWDSSGVLTTRRIRTQRLLGSGLAGTVYLVEDEHGATYVEKHYGPIPADGSKRWGRKLAAAIFAFFRQAPLSFRELPEAVVATHLSNRFVVALSRARFGSAITPPLLYTRYDERTAGYVQAFPFVEGRPLQPWKPGLPLAGEAAVFFPVMQKWRDFLAHDLGFWGLARQVDPANLNAYSNLWITADRHLVLLDIIPGLPGFLEPRYLWWGLRRGHFPPFGDAIDFGRLADHLERSGLDPPDEWRSDFRLLRVATQMWQDSEPRLWSSPSRLGRVLVDARLRQATRRSLLIHLEVKGAVTRDQAREYRLSLASTGRFPKVGRHSLLKMAPLGIHRLLTDGTYARRVLVRSWRLPGRIARRLAFGLQRVADRTLRLLTTLGRLVLNRQARIERCRVLVTQWIDDAERLGRLSSASAAAMREEIGRDEETADLAELFGLHLLISAFKHSLVGPSAFWLGLALATGNWWLATPMAIAPTLRLVAALWLGFGRRLGLLVLCALPDVGVLAAPLYLLQRRPALGGFIVRGFGQKAALKIPGFGERGALVEMLGVAATQVLVVDPARMLPVVVVTGLVGFAKHWILVSWASVVIYVLAVVWATYKRWRTARLHPTEPTKWMFGFPEEPREAATSPPVLSARLA